MFKEVVSLAIILGFILNIFYVKHPNTTSYTIAFLLSMAVISPVALAWRYRASLRQLRAIRDAVEEAEEEHFVSGSEAIGLGKDTQSNADVEMGLVQTDGTAAVPLEATQGSEETASSGIRFQ
jgi:hypothetical protein